MTYTRYDAHFTAPLGSPFRPSPADGGVERRKVKQRYTDRKHPTTSNQVKNLLSRRRDSRQAIRGTSQQRHTRTRSAWPLGTSGVGCRWDWNVRLVVSPEKRSRNVPTSVNKPFHSVANRISAKPGFSRHRFLSFSLTNVEH
jgi:hypothetical protein